MMEMDDNLKNVGYTFQVVPPVFKKSIFMAMISFLFVN